MHIESIPMCEYHGQETCVTCGSTYAYCDIAGTGSSNNYAYLVKDDATNDAVIIDPANPPESALLPTMEERAMKLIMSLRVAPVLKERTDQGKINLTAIMNTHQ